MGIMLYLKSIIMSSGVPFALREDEMRKKITWKDILDLQAVVVIYTFSTIIGKFAAGQEGITFLLYYGAEVAVLGVYAILWQQMIKKFDLSIAYANRAVALVWSLLWAVLIFQEQLTVKKVAGVVLVIAGTVIVNGGKEKENAA